MRVAGTLCEPRMDRTVIALWMGYWEEADSDLANLIQSYID